jgi:hypothetical protein
MFGAGCWATYINKEQACNREDPSTVVIAGCGGGGGEGSQGRKRKAEVLQGKPDHHQLQQQQQQQVQHLPCSFEVAQAAHTGVKKVSSHSPQPKSHHCQDSDAQ